MTRAEKLYTLFSSFGLTAYEENCVPDGATMPYITYRYMCGDFGKPTSTTASIWYRTTSMNDPTAKAEQISNAIGMGGHQFNGLWVRRGTPFAQTQNDPDDSVKRIILNLDIEFFNE